MHADPPNPADVESLGPDYEPTGYDGLLRLRFEHVGGTEVRAFMVVEEQHLQPFGLVHGGVYASIAESLASMGTFVGVGGGKAVAGMSNNTSFMRPAFLGDTLRAVGVPKHTGRTTWVWDIDITGDAGKPIASTRVTIAVRDMPPAN